MPTERITFIHNFEITTERFLSVLLSSIVKILKVNKYENCDPCVDNTGNSITKVIIEYKNHPRKGHS